MVKNFKQFLQKIFHNGCCLNTIKFLYNIVNLLIIIICEELLWLVLEMRNLYVMVTN